MVLKLLRVEILVAPTALVALRGAIVRLGARGSVRRVICTGRYQAAGVVLCRRLSLIPRFALGQSRYLWRVLVEILRKILVLVQLD